MAERLKSARPFADMLFAARDRRRSASTRPNSARRSSGASARRSAKIADETLRRHYQADMRRRLATFFGDERERRPRRAATARAGAAFGARRGGPFPPRGPRVGLAEAPLPPQSKLGRKAARSRRARS